MPSSRSNAATPFCRRCFKRLKENGLRFLFGFPPICKRCYQELSPKWIRWKEGGASCLAIYQYNEAVRSTLYQFKGLGDIELASAFFGYQSPYLRLLYRHYWVVPIPSSPSHDQARGFNQVREMAACLGLPIIDALRKKEGAKQSDLPAKERTKVGELLELAHPELIQGRRVLLLDDVFTTGSTARACLELLKRAKPRKIRFLAMAKTMGKTP